MSNQAILDLNGGEYTSKIDARSDVEKFASGCRTLENMIPTIFGGVTKRPGTEFISNNAAFNTILAALIAHEGTGLCWENDPLATGFQDTVDQIMCHENRLLCYENEILVKSSGLTFIAKALCHENSVVFYENEVLITE